MHEVRIPDHVVQRVIRKRGTAHPYAEMDPRRTALLVIDMQNGYMHPDLAHTYVPSAAGIVPAINRLAGAVRRTGGAVYWIQNASDERSRAEWSVLEDHVTSEQREARVRSMRPGSTGHALWPELDLRPGDAVVAKFRYSAFIPGAAAPGEPDLAERLRARGIDTVLITGTLTNVCCESSARDAMMLNFRVMMVSDANAAITDEEHNASLVNLYLTFGDVMPAAEVESCLERGARRDAA